MKFTEVAPMMEKGAKIKLKQWKNAYWYLDNKGCLINHFEEGEEIPAADLFPYTLAWGLCNDWEIVQEPKVEKFTPLVTPFLLSRTVRRLPVGVGTAKECFLYFALVIRFPLTT